MTSSHEQITDVSILKSVSLLWLTSVLCVAPILLGCWQQGISSILTERWQAILALILTVKLEISFYFLLIPHPTTRRIAAAYEVVFAACFAVVSAICLFRSANHAFIANLDLTDAFISGSLAMWSSIMVIVLTTSSVCIATSKT